MMDGERRMQAEGGVMDDVARSQDGRRGDGEAASEPAVRPDQPSRERILSACVKLFLEKGYRGTTVADITRLARVSNSSFQHFFGHKDGVLLELIHFMYDSQFAAADALGDAGTPPLYAYAVETAVQLAICEISPTLRELYLESYTHEDTLDYIQRATARRLLEAFGPYQPQLTEHDFLGLDVGTSGLMRGYMARPCGDGFTLETKVSDFLTLALRGLGVPEAEVGRAVAYVLTLDLRGMARQVVAGAVHVLAERYEVSIACLIDGEGQVQA